MPVEKLVRTAAYLQYDGTNRSEILSYIDNDFGNGGGLTLYAVSVVSETSGVLTLSTNFGNVVFNTGDWMIAIYEPLMSDTDRQAQFAKLSDLL